MIVLADAAFDAIAAGLGDDQGNGLAGEIVGERSGVADFGVGTIIDAVAELEAVDKGSAVASGGTCKVDGVANLGGANVGGEVVADERVVFWGETDF